MQFQNTITAAASLGTAYYCFKGKKPILISALLVVLAGGVSYIVGGYIDTIKPTKK